MCPLHSAMNIQKHSILFSPLHQPEGLGCSIRSARHDPRPQNKLDIIRALPMSLRCRASDFDNDLVVRNGRVGRKVVKLNYLLGRPHRYIGANE